MLNIEELDKKFDELLKDFDEEYINGWIRKKIEEEKEEKLNKRSEQLFCIECGTAFEYDWHVEYDNCPKCGCDVAK